MHKLALHKLIKNDQSTVSDQELFPEDYFIVSHGAEMFREFTPTRNRGAYCANLNY